MTTESMCRESPEPASLSRTGFPYAIYVRGHLDAYWAEWLGGVTITHEAAGLTRIVGPMKDQAGLYGLLNTLRDLHLELVAVQRLSAAVGDSPLPAEQPSDGALPNSEHRVRCRGSGGLGERGRARAAKACSE